MASFIKPVEIMARKVVLSILSEDRHWVVGEKDRESHGLCP